MVNGLKHSTDDKTRPNIFHCDTDSDLMRGENAELLKRGTGFASSFHLSTPIVNDYHIFFRRDRLIIVMVSWDNSGRNQLSTCQPPILHLPPLYLYSP